VKTLRVRIDDALWLSLRPLIRHGEISRILRHALRAYLKEKDVTVGGKK
jgi:hypothetical protein